MRTTARVGEHRRTAKRLLALFAAGAVCAFAAPGARANDGLILGVTDDLFKADPARAGAVAADLGLQAASISLRWDGQAALTDGHVRQLNMALSTGLRMVVAVYGGWWTVPDEPAEREAYCGFIGDLLARYPQINDVVIWNEPNLSYFWRPQFDSAGASVAPAAYEALLARCWDVAHAIRPNANIIAPATSPWGFDDPKGVSGTISHSPTEFAWLLGAAYRASGRDRPIFDTVAHHPYGEDSLERPWRKHTSGKRVAEGDLERLLGVYQAAFTGTAQPFPGAPAGARSAPLWYLEIGFETVPDDAKRGAYFNTQPRPALPDFSGVAPWTTRPDPESPAPDQATQLRDALRLAYCQPHVDAFFNFLLADEPNLTTWQSGVLWADGTPKDSYSAFRDALREARDGRVNCALFGYPQPPRVTAATTTAGATAAGVASQTAGGVSTKSSTAAKPSTIVLKPARAGASRAAVLAAAHRWQHRLKAATKLGRRWVKRLTRLHALP